MSDYPERLLPKPHYSIIEEEVLMSQRGLWLIRHVDSDKAIFIGDTNTLNPACIQIQSDHLRDLSNNLLGIFQVEDVYYGIEKSVIISYCELWNGSEECAAPLEGDYFIDRERGYYFIPVDELLNNFVNISNADNEQDDKYHFKILHTPTKCNFWHISIRVYDTDDNEVSRLAVSKNKKKRIWKTVKDYLVSSVVMTEMESDYSVIEKSVYCKNN